MTPVTRKTTTITTSSWRANTKNAKKILKQTKKTETKAKPETTVEAEISPENEEIDEKQEAVDNILSDDVKGILRELQLDVVPASEQPVKKAKKSTLHQAPPPGIDFI